MTTIKFKKLSENATTPTKARKNDAAFDLYAADDVAIEYGETTIVSTDIAIELPDGFFADVRNRSGLTLKSSLRVHLGTIDANYRGNIGVIVENADHELMTKQILETVIGIATQDEELLDSIDPDKSTIYIKKGDRIAQLLIQEQPYVILHESDNLSDSERGENGFGSTGTR